MVERQQITFKTSANALITVTLGQLFGLLKSSPGKIRWGSERLQLAQNKLQPSVTGQTDQQFILDWSMAYSVVTAHS